MSLYSYFQSILVSFHTIKLLFEKGLLQPTHSLAIKSGATVRQMYLSLCLLHNIQNLWQPLLCNSNRYFWLNMSRDHQMEIMEYVMPTQTKLQLSRKATCHQPGILRQIVSCSLEYQFSFGTLLKQYLDFLICHVNIMSNFCV